MSASDCLQSHQRLTAPAPLPGAAHTTTITSPATTGCRRLVAVNKSATPARLRLRHCCWHSRHWRGLISGPTGRSWAERSRSIIAPLSMPWWATATTTAPRHHLSAFPYTRRTNQRLDPSHLLQHAHNIINAERHGPLEDQWRQTSRRHFDVNAGCNTL
jgi:hypothetical protein